jgi:hypothetical protein
MNSRFSEVSPLEMLVFSLSPQSEEFAKMNFWESFGKVRPDFIHFKNLEVQSF